jgi:hypothetical protein
MPAEREQQRQAEERPVAGRELDALIAEKAFRFCVNRPPMCWGMVAPGDERPWFESVQTLPPYSTKITAAMTVFERVVEMVGYGSISADMEDCRGEGFVCAVTFGTVDGGEVTHTAPLPEAICNAALAALRASGDGAALLPEERP